MKNLYVIIVFLSFLFIACNKEDDPIPVKTTAEVNAEKILSYKFKEASFKSSILPDLVQTQIRPFVIETPYIKFIDLYDNTYVLPLENLLGIYPNGSWGILYFK